MKQRSKTFFEITEEANKAAKELYHAFFYPLLPFVEWLNKKLEQSGIL